ncbi:hypothetical protein [Metabacillus arenae]|uniref:hypothetical protein n=1 Tax=Metabacillus arenae TaxID=2771434 RepID=UPI0017478A92|nr:hypothetical protein [Metabacillus arenae]
MEKVIPKILISFGRESIERFILKTISGKTGFYSSSRHIKGEKLIGNKKNH